jgi:O-glycosyl hydrolase
MLTHCISGQAHRFLGSLLSIQKLPAAAPSKSVHLRFGFRSFGRRSVCNALIVAAVAVVPGLSAPVHAQNPNNFDTANIMQAIKNPHSDLSILASHRGLHALVDGSYPNVPENSLQAIQVTAAAGLEVIELDIKNTSDGVPVLSHDLTLGRETNYGWWNVGQHEFDPFASPNPTDDARNPPVNGITLSNLQAIYNGTGGPHPDIQLRDSIAFYYSAASEGVSSLQNALDYIKANRIAMVISLDIRDAATAQAAWNVISNNTDYLGRPSSQSTVFKFGAKLFKDTASFKGAFPNYTALNWIPVYSTSDIQPSAFGSEQAMIQHISAFESDGTLSIAGLEIGYKQSGGILGDVLSAARTNFSTGRPETVGMFSPYADYYDPSDTNKATPLFFQTNGYCCIAITGYFYDGSPNGQPSDTADYRGSFDFVTGYAFNFITTDTAVTTGNATNYNSRLAGLGKRDISYMQAGGPQGFTYCTTENRNCNFSGTAQVAFGTPQGPWVIVTAYNGIACDLTQFSPDPAPGVVKTCYYQLSNQGGSGGGGALAGGPVGYSYCAPENSTCSFSGTAEVAFGPPQGPWDYGAANNGILCSLSVFSPDPSPGVVKDCYFQPTSQGNQGLNGGLTSSGFSGPGEPTGSIPVLSPYTTATFTVQAGGTSFTVSQPNDSVATYTWADGGTPAEVVTSASGSALGYALNIVPVGTYSGAVPSATITVNASTTYQTIDGFGGAMTDSAASLILGSPNSNTILQTLFGTSTGQAGLTMVRSPMGSSDLMASPTDIHTYEDTPGSFSSNAYASDQRQITALQQAKAIAGSNFKLLGTPWSAPGWMKRGGSLLPAQCGTDQNELYLGNVNQYAAYFADYIHTYSSAGLTPWAVSMQNEPENCKTTMPTTLMSATDEVALAKAIKSTIPGGVKVLGWDHNWNDPDYVNTLVNSGSVDAVGYHCYDGTHYANQTQSVATYMTECSGFTASSSNVAYNLGWEVANLLIGPLRYGSHGSIYWTLAQDPSGNPHLAGPDACSDCRGMITVNGDGSFEPSQDLYYFAQFSKFVPPGSVRVDSNNSGNLSTVAFRNGNQNTLVVLNSATTQANGGVAGSDEHDLRGHILQWDGDTAAQKTAWLVGSDGYRRWISDGSTFNCLVYDAGMQGPYVEMAGALDKYINLLNVWTVCGQVTMGTDSELEVGTYLKSTNGGRLTLTASGLTATDASGSSHWAPPGAGNRLILQEDQNLVLYAGTNPVWASNTAGSGAVWLSMRDDGTFALFNAANQEVWVSQINPGSYKGKIVQWEGDTAAQKTSWFVGWDGNRRWIPDLPTFQCLHDAGAGNALSLSTEALNQLPNLTNVWEACGGSQIGVNGTLELGSHLQAGAYSLTQTANDLVLTTDVLVNGSFQIWDSGKGGYYTILQPDGNLVEYAQEVGISTWAAATNKSNPGNLILGTDGSLRLWDASGNNVWSRIPGEVPTAPLSAFNYCGNEGSTCNFIGTATVIFGTDAAHYTSRNFTNTAACSDNNFPEDPNPGVAKMCWYGLYTP